MYIYPNPCMMVAILCVLLHVYMDNVCKTLRIRRRTRRISNIQYTTTERACEACSVVVVVDVRATHGYATRSLAYGGGVHTSYSYSSTKQSPPPPSSLRWPSSLHACKHKSTGGIRRRWWRRCSANSTHLACANGLTHQCI